MGELLGIVVTRYPGLIVPDERMGLLLTRTPESGRRAFRRVRKLLDDFQPDVLVQHDVASGPGSIR